MGWVDQNDNYTQVAGEYDNGDYGDIVDKGEIEAGSTSIMRCDSAEVAEGFLLWAE
jgi:hypothetical protein